MFNTTPGNTQVYSPFGSYVVEQHNVDGLRSYIDRLPRPDLKFGADHPLGQNQADEQSAA